MTGITHADPSAAGDPPTVTVVVPTRDRPALLDATLRSVLAQSGVAIEVVVVDDGSAVPVTVPNGGSTRSRVRVLRNERSLGVGASRNRGAAVARAPWVAFCDDDDLWIPDKLAGQVAAATANSRRWAYTGAVKFEQGPTLWQVMPPPSPEQVQSRLGTRNLIPAGASNVLVDRDLLLEVGGFDESLRHLGDWDLWLRLLEHGLPACSPGLGVAYRLHPGAMSRTPRGILDELRLLDERWRHLRDDEPLDPGPTHLWIAMNDLRSGRRLEAARSYLRAARHHPGAGLRGLVRTLHPQPPRPAHVLARPEHRVPRFKNVEQVEVPAPMLRLLEALAGDPGRG